MAKKQEGMLDEIPDTPAGTEPAEPVAPEPAPEPEPEPVKEEGEHGEEPNPAKSPDRPEGYVPEQSLREAREELKAIRRQLRERDKQYGSLEERTNLILKQYFTEDGQPVRQQTNGQAPKKQNGAAPDPEQDIFGAVKHLLRENEQLKGNYGQIQQQGEQQRVANTLRSAYVQDAQRFEAATSDFKDAYAHIIRGRDSELSRLGVTDPGQRQAMIEAEELQIVANAVQREESPAEIIYELAKMRGYVPKQVQPAQSGQAPDLQRLAQSQERNKSLSTGAGAPAAGQLTARDLAKMSEDDIHALMRTRSGRLAVDRAMGIQH